MRDLIGEVWNMGVKLSLDIDICFSAFLGG